MNLEKINQAYQAENLSGSYFTAPLKNYNRWFSAKIQASEGACQKLAYQACYAVSAIFAYLTLGTFALIGIAVNLCIMPPENGYSLWARLNGVPKATEEFCSKLRRELSFACRTRANMNMINAQASSTRGYTYSRHQRLSFEMQEAPETMEQLGRRLIHIQNTVRDLSQKHGWIPEKLLIQSDGGRASLIIPFPDHITLEV